MTNITEFIIENALVLIAGIAFAFLVIRAVLKSREISLLSREVISFREILEFSPEPFFVWLKDKKKNYYPLASRKLSIILGLEKGRNSDFDEVLEKLETPEKLAAKFETLQNEGDRFVIDVKIKNKDRYFLCEGNKIVTFSGEELAIIIWFKDISERYLAMQSNKDVVETLETEKKYYESIIDALPFPVWVRNDGQLVSDCNNKYVKAVEVFDKNWVKRNHTELGQGNDVKEIRSLAIKAKKENKSQSDFFSIVMDNELKNIEINETVLDDNMTLGWAREIGNAEFGLDEMTKQKELYTNALDYSPFAVLIMDNKLNIQYYNQNFLKMWNVEGDIIENMSGFGDFLGELKKSGKLPDNRDFPVYKQQELKFYSEISQPFTDIIYLPGDVVIKRSIVPDDNGGTITYFEDVSVPITTERNFYTLSENYRITLDNVKTAVAVFGDNGRVKMVNSSFLSLWNLDSSTIENLLLSEVLDLKKHFFDKEYNWVDVKSEMLSHITSGTTQVITMERNDNRVIDCTSVRLIDGSIMLSYETRL